MKISDEKLLALCEDFGKRAIVWRRKFTGLLPEVNRRRLYERRGCQSIFEFGAKLAGLSEEQVWQALRLERQFVDKPALHKLLVEGRVSMNKLVRVASLATTENEAELAEKVRVLPRGALETFVRDGRASREQNGSKKTLFDAKSLHVQGFQLSSEVIQELNRLNTQGQDVNAILLDLLKQRKEKIAEEKAALAGQAATSRHIPAMVRAVLKEEYGKKCAIRTCIRPSEELHHTQRFSVSHSHDPNYLAPLCKEHHQLAHLADLHYREMTSLPKPKSGIK